MSQKVPALKMCQINATDIFDRIKGLRGTRTDVLRGATAAGALFFYDSMFDSKNGAANAAANAQEELDDLWTQHNGVFTEEDIKDFTTTPSGLLYKDVMVGKGATPNDGDAVTLNMVGYIFETGEKWTNTYKGIPSYQSVVRAGARPNQKFMKGLNDGVLNMKKGGKRILVIPAYLAYNYVAIYSQQNPSVTIIPAGAALVCYVEVMSFKPLPK
jgi:peptidylprolyl isomerase